MSEIHFTELTDRKLLHVSGSDAVRFLHGIMTCNVETLDTGDAAFGALLSPQGKILFDFFIYRSSKSLIIDIDREQADAFVTRLQFYRLRADVSIEALKDTVGCFAVHGSMEERPPALNGIVYADPRLAKMGMRAYLETLPNGLAPKSLDVWHRLRIELGMPAGGIDYEFGDAFPHEALMDQFRGVDFTKGCYVGQEVVSRMQHRGTARKRLVKVSAETDLPDSGTAIMAGEKACGSITSVSGCKGIAMVRLDRAAKAMQDGEQLASGDVSVSLSIPDWCQFGWPESDAA